MKKFVLIIFINVILFSLTACYNIDNMCDIVGHYYKDIVISPTCEKEGYTLHQCEDCSYSYIDAEKKALGHNIIEVEEVFPTCNNEGNSAGTKCSRCNDKNDYTIYPALGHNMIIDSRVEPTCTETGLTEGSHCSRCDHVIVQEVIAALGHNYTAVVTKPTCESDGYTTHTCDRCDDEYVDSYVDALGHDMIIDERVEPTCTETGLTEGSHCSRCNFKIEQEIIPELGHIEEVTIQGLVPTNEKSGLSEQIECSVCNEILQEQILLPAKGYDWIIEDNEIKILLVGNSYTEDATSCAQGPIDNSPLLSIIQSMVGEDIKVTIGVIISGGKGMNWHATKAENNTTAYYFKTINSETKVWSSSKSMTMKNALTYTNWDMVSLQPYSINTTTGIESNAYPEQTNSEFLHIKDSSAYLLDYVQQFAPQAEIYLYMHWAQTSSISKNAALSKYNDMAKFYPSILEYQGETTGKRFTNLVPVGLSIQNARTTYLSLLAYNTTAYTDKNLNYTTDAQIGLQRDGGHVSFNVGRYIASLTFAEQIIPESLRVLEYILPDIRYTESIGQLPKEYTEIAQLSVFAAIESWKNRDLGVTNIDGYDIDPIKLAKTNLEQLTLYLDNCTEEEFVKKLNYLIINELSSEYVIDGIEINHVDGFVTFKLRFGYMSETITLSYDVNKNGHNLIIDEKVEPTCITTGLTEGSHCTRCSYKIDQEIIDIIDHIYEKGVCIGCGKVSIGPVITLQPTDVKAAIDEPFCVTVEAVGESLKYQWYVKEKGTTTWIKSSITDNTYDTVMNSHRAGRQIYCIITDIYGNFVVTNTVTLILIPPKPTHIWDQWTQPVVMTAGTHPTYGGSSTGYYSKGQVFNGILYSSTHREGRDTLWNFNYSTYYSAIANPASLLYTTDYRGRVFNEAAWTGSVCSTTALKACGYAYPYTTAEIPMIFDEKIDHNIDNIEFGDLLWTKGHVAGVIDVIIGNDGHVERVKIIEQASYVKIFEITSQNWDNYFNKYWTHIYHGDCDKSKTVPEEYSENLSIIFERGNNTYVTNCEKMLFYIPTASTVYVTTNGVTSAYNKDIFPKQIINEVTVYDLASLFTGIGDYYFHTEENNVDICIKVINCGKISISGETATLSGYENCKILGYRIIKILDESKSKSYNFFEAQEGYTSEVVNLSFQWLNDDIFNIENIPQDVDGWKLEVYYDTGFGWARALSEDIIF